MAREHALSCFAVVVCRHPLTKLWLAVQETSKHNNLWWLPAGGVEAGESFIAAAYREAMEEAGIAIQLKGILRIEHSSCYGRMRIVFYAEPLDPTASVKTIPDKESNGATWMSVDALKELSAQGKLRGKELLEWATYLEANGTIAPLSILGTEVLPPEVHPQPSEFRVFFQPKKPSHRYTSISTEHEEVRTDVYLVHSPDVGIKYRKGKQLEVKKRVQAYGDGWEVWTKFKCQSQSIESLSAVGIAPLSSEPRSVTIEKRRVQTVVAGLYMVEETDLIVDGQVWKSICVEGYRQYCQDEVDGIRCALLDEDYTVEGYPAFVVHFAKEG